MMNNLAGKERISADIDKVTQPFIENKGQVDGRVAYYLNAKNGHIFIEKTGALVFSFSGIDKSETQNKTKQIVFKIIPESTDDRKQEATIYGEDKNRAVVNYFTGAKENWHAAVPTYNSVSCDAIFDGIKMTYRAGLGLVEDIYTVAPGSDPSDIRFRVDGASFLRTNEDGELLIDIEGQVFTVRAPFAYQEIHGKRVSVPVRFDIEGLGYGFSLAGYDKTSPLIIDPELVYSTFLGGSGGRTSGYGATDTITDVQVHSNGYIYVTGSTRSYEYPTTPGSFKPTLDYTTYGVVALSVIKPSGDGKSDLVYSTYLGSGFTNSGKALTVGSDGKAYIVGTTRVDSFPTTPQAFDPSFGGGCDGFLTIIDPQGNGPSDLVYSTFIGGSGEDEALGVDIDSIGRVHVTGYTKSADFPHTPGAYDETYNGTTEEDAFYLVINPASEGSSDLVYSTFLGNSGIDRASDVAVDGNNRAYISGYTESALFPTVDGSYDVSHNGSSDIFMVRINPVGEGASDLQYATLLGGSSDDTASGHNLALSRTDNVYLFCSSSSDNVPTTAGAYDKTYSSSDAFLWVINPKKLGPEDLLYASYFGGSNYEYGLALLSMKMEALISQAPPIQILTFPLRPEYMMTRTTVSQTAFWPLSTLS